MIRKMQVPLFIASLMCLSSLSFAASGDNGMQQQNEAVENLSASTNRLVVYPDGAGGFQAMYFDENGNILRTSESVDTGDVIHDSGNNTTGNMMEQRATGFTTLQMD